MGGCFTSPLIRVLQIWSGARSMEKKLIFVNATEEPFTPTCGGAIATWIWEMCRAAEGLGLEPWVATGRSLADHYPWVRTVEIGRASAFPVGGLALSASKKRVSEDRKQLAGKKWSGDLLGMIRQRQWQRGTFVFHNAPEIVAALRPRLPEARLIHLFHNAKPCSPQLRERFASSVDVAVAVSAHCARWNESYFGCAIHTLRNGVDLKRFVPLPKTQNQRPLIGFVGHTVRDKGPDLLLRAALNLAEGFNGFDIQLLGARISGGAQNDPYHETLETLIGRLEKRGVSVDRPGFVNRFAMPRLLARADIHVVPSRWEDPCPLTVLEGMATGQATVAASCGGIPEIVGGAGFVFERDDVAGLEARLRVLLQNEELRRAYGRRARERAEQRPWSLVFQELLEIINF